MFRGSSGDGTKGSRKRKDVPVFGKKSMGFGSGLQRAAVTLSKSISQGSGPSRRKMLLNEAQASIRIGKVLGMDYEGNEEEVTSRIIELEEKDRERIEDFAKGVVIAQN